jgi:hypothetical protein
MFCRQLNMVLAYGSGYAPSMSVTNFIRLLNPSSFEQQGFSAEYVGGSGVALLGVDTLFPVGGRLPATDLPGWTGRVPDDLISDQPIGSLPDDRGFAVPLGAETRHSKQLIVLPHVGAGCSQTVISTDHIADHPLVTRLPSFRDFPAVSEVPLVLSVLPPLAVPPLDPSSFPPPNPYAPLMTSDVPPLVNGGSPLYCEDNMLPT